jgi:hypothetical protein
MNYTLSASVILTDQNTPGPSLDWHNTFVGKKTWSLEFGVSGNIYSTETLWSLFSFVYGFINGVCRIRDNPVSVATNWAAGVRIPRHPERLWDPPSQKCQGREVSTEIKKGGAIPPFPHMCPWHSSYLINHKDNFTFTLQMSTVDLKGKGCEYVNWTGQYGIQWRAVVSKIMKNDIY